MEAVKAPVNPGSTILYLSISLIAALAVGCVAYMIITNNKTMASGNWEGFQGPSKGVSDIPCGQESSFAIQLSDLFASKVSTTEDGEADLTEFKVILSKLCCFKHDLMSTNQIVMATKTVPFNTSHDRENLGDTTGRCFRNAMPVRDLNIIFDTWKDRGQFLLDRLCTSYNLSKQEGTQANNAFMSVFSDTLSIARTVCISDYNDGKTKVSPRDLKGYTPEEVKELGPYNGYY